MTVATSPSLLVRLGNTDDREAWDRFYSLYAPLVIGFARQRGASLEAAHDVLQETMVCVLRALPRFQYDSVKGRFRSFLMRIVDARVKDAYRRGRRYQALDTDSRPAAWLDTLPEAPPRQVCETWDRLWVYNRLLAALGKVRARVNITTWRSFEMYVLEEQPVEAVAAALELTPNAVYQHRARLLRMLRREADVLRAEMGD